MVSCLFASEAAAHILTLTPSLSVGERYDDNIFQTAAAESDFVTVVTPRIVLHYLPARETTIDLDYSAGIERFADHTDQNQVSHRGSLLVASRLSRLLTLNAREALVITEEPAERQLEIVDVTGLRTSSEQSRQRTLRNTAAADLRVQLAPRIDSKLSFENLIEDVSVPDEVDEFRYTLGADVGYLLYVRRDSRVSLGYTGTLHTFRANDGVAAGQDVADFTVHTVNTGWRHPFSRILSAALTAGYSVTTSDDPALDGEAGFVGSVNVTRRLRTGQAEVGYRRRFTSGGGEGGTVVADTFTMALSARVLPKITARLDTNLSFFNFRQAELDRRFWTIRPGLVYQALRFWTLVLNYSFALTNYDAPVLADQMDHRLSFVSQLALGEHLALDLTYRYASRRLGSGALVTTSDAEFERNEVSLILRYMHRLLL